MPHTLETIKASCVEVGDCWEWQGCYGGERRNHPYVRQDGHGTTVRRVVLQLVGKGRKTKNQQMAFATCGNFRCVNPDHLRWATQSEAMQAAGISGKLSSPARSAKIAAAKRAATSPLTMEMARAIRASNERYIDLAARYGVAKSVIAGIKQYRSWKEYTTPFSGLGARP